MNKFQENLKQLEKSKDFKKIKKLQKLQENSKIIVKIPRKLEEIKKFQGEKI